MPELHVDKMPRMSAGIVSCLFTFNLFVFNLVAAHANPSPHGTWVLIGAPNPPSGRFDHSAIYDPVRDRMVLFGGYDGLHRNDVWSLSLAQTPMWTELVTSGTPPSARRGHTAIYDPRRDRMVVFGGSDGSPLNDVWALSLESLAWTQLTPTGTPPSPRHSHSAIYDWPRDRVVVFGGFDSFGFNRNDVRALSLAGSPAWIGLSPGGTLPSARRAHAAIYDPLRDRMVMFGGFDGSTPSPYRNDVWALSLGGSLAWAQLAPTGTPPSGRSEHSAIYDPVRDRFVVFAGGTGTAPFFNDTWALSIAGSPAWAQLTPSGTPPSGRLGHSAIYDSVVDRMVVWGGMGGETADGWALLWGEPAAVSRPSTSVSATGIARILPNPSRAQHAIEISVASGVPAKRLSVFSASGRLIWSRDLSGLPAGLHAISWDGSSIDGSLAPASVYLVTLESVSGLVTRKLVRLP